MMDANKTVNIWVETWKSVLNRILYNMNTFEVGQKVEVDQFK